MRKTLLTLALLLAVVSLHAGSVTKQQARDKAAQFLASRRQGTANKTMHQPMRQPQLQQEAAASVAGAYYVFNIGDGGGFVVASGDDRTPAILGYADSGHFDAGNVPDGMKAWLQSMKEELSLTVNAPMASTGVSQRKAPSVRSSIAPLITTRWDQEDPYNRIVLDTTEFKTKVLAGCVATALAQLMNYHARLTGKPEKVLAEITSYITDNRYFRVDAIPAGTSIDWGNMLDTYTKDAKITSDEQQKQVDAVANLFRICGASVKMTYWTTGSYTDSGRAAIALKDYFGYDENIYIAHREDYSLEGWNQLIYDELMLQRPVLFSGFSSSNGHAFLVDGFDGDEYFHVNWGWGGHCDGYYLLGVANPVDKTGAGAGSSYDGYAMGQTATIGAQPKDEANPIEAKELHITFNNIITNGNEVTFDAFNENVKTAKFQLGIARIADDGTLTIIGSPKQIPELPYNYGYYGMSYTLSAGNNGTSKLALVSREVGTDKWITRMNPTNYYIEMNVNGGNVTLSMVEPQPVFTLLSISPQGTMKSGVRQAVEATVSNNGDEFYGNVRFIASLAQTADTCTVGLSIAKGQTQTVVFEFTPEKAGVYNVKIETESQSPIVIYEGTFTVEEKPSSSVKLGIDMVIENLNARKTAILGSKAHVAITVTNDTDIAYYGVFVPVLAPNGESFSYSPVSRLFEAHSTTTVEEVFDVVIGKSYIPVCITNSGTYQSQWAYKASPAVTFYYADGTNQAIEATASITVADGVTSVDLTGNSTTTAVQPSANANCMYFLSEDAEVPAGLTVNVVKGSRAEELHISDDALPFKPAFDFTADTVVYTRTFDSGVTATIDDGNVSVKPAWTTICLPFEADRILAPDGKAVMWRNTENEENYNFWLAEFLGDERGTLYFAQPETFSAYKPYLIAVPGKGLEGLSDMTAGAVSFCGRNASLRAATTACIAASSRYKFVGTMESVTDNNGAYAIDADGTMCRRATVTEKPFRAYVKAVSTTAAANEAPISITPAIMVTPELSETVKGDVNGDGTVDVADISGVISVMAGGMTVDVSSADVNGDGTVDVADISAVITIMAGK